MKGLTSIATVEKPSNNNYNWRLLNINTVGVALTVGSINIDGNAVIHNSTSSEITANILLNWIGVKIV